ncbi:unnamed protein product [Musa hybrid cultivar]
MTAMPHRRRPWHRLPRCKDVVTKGPFLCHGSATFVVQGDNNLVLYNKGPGFQFDTHGDGVNCTLSLTDRGQFVITASDGLRVWSSKVPNTAKTGKHAAVLRSNGQVAVYGPALRSTPNFNLSAAGSRGAEQTALGKVENVLFSSQILDEQDKLATRDYTLVMRGDCDLALVKAPAIVAWQSGTVGKGAHCFLRLDHKRPARRGRRP